MDESTAILKLCYTALYSALQVMKTRTPEKALYFQECNNSKISKNEFCLVSNNVITCRKLTLSSPSLAYILIIIHM